MTVAELIAELEKHNPDAVVFRHGHPDGGGLDEVDYVEAVIAKDCGYYCSYAGRFDSVEEGADGAVKGVRIW